MFPTPLPVLRPDEFSRCEERVQERDRGNISSPSARTDASLKGSVEHAIWNDEVLRAIEYYEIDTHAKNGIVYLNGHIANTTSRIRIETAIRSVPGILALRNHLVLDEKLTLEIASGLGELEHTFGCKFFTGSSHGVVSIQGIVSNEDVKLLAEISASRNPHVRAVMNHVRVAGAIGPDLQELPFLQPSIGETIYFLDGPLGVVKQVVINPNNRRVIAMILLVNFPNMRLPADSASDGKTSLPTQLVHVPMDTIRYLTTGSGFLLINSHERDRYQDFNPASFIAPSLDWTPPYPYCPQDVLFPVAYREADVQAADVRHPFPVEELLEGASLQQEFIATDHPDS